MSLDDLLPLVAGNANRQQRQKIQDRMRSSAGDRAFVSWSRGVAEPSLGERTAPTCAAVLLPGVAGCTARPHPGGRQADPTLGRAAVESASLRSAGTCRDHRVHWRSQHAYIDAAHRVHALVENRTPGTRVTVIPEHKLEICNVN
jgi:hypothetical protein